MCSRSLARANALQASRRGNVSERLVPIVLIQRVGRAVSAQKEVRVSVAVVIAPGNTRVIGRRSDACSGCNIGKRIVAVVAIELVVGTAADIDVRIAILVKVEPSRPTVAIDICDPRQTSNIGKRTGAVVEVEAVGMRVTIRQINVEVPVSVYVSPRSGITLIGWVLHAGRGRLIGEGAVVVVLIEKVGSLIVC